MADLDTFEAALKVKYGVQSLYKQVIKNRPALGMLPKREGMGGKTIPFPLVYGDSQNISAGFEEATRIDSGAAATSSALITDWEMKRKKKYAKAFLDRETMMASMGDTNAFASVTTTELDSAVNGLSNALHADIFGDGTGALGALASATNDALPVCTLANREDASKLSLGMAVRFSSTTTATSALATEIVTITSLNRKTGVFILSGTVTDVDVAGGAGKHFFRHGDRPAAALTATSQYRNIFGFAAWIPVADPSGGESFNGVDRSTDRVRLAGNVIDWEGSIQKTLFAASIECGRQGAGGDKVCFMNDSDVQTLIFEYDNKLEHRRETSPGTLEVGFDGYKVRTPHGTVTVFADRQCPVGICYVGDPNVVCLGSLAGIPHLIDESGKYLRSHTTDSYQVEFGTYWFMAIKSPGQWAVCDLTA